MLTIAFEGAGGAMLILAAIILAVPSHWSDKSGKVQGLLPDYSAGGRN